MIRVEIKSVLEMLEKRTGRRPTLSEISRETKIHRNVLSNLFKDPSTKVTTHDIDRLVKYAYEKLRDKDNPRVRFATVRKSERELMESILKSLVVVVPEPPEMPEPDELTPEQLKRHKKFNTGDQEKFRNPEIFAQLSVEDIWIWYRRALAMKEAVLTGEFPNPDVASDIPLASEHPAKSSKN